MTMIQFIGVLALALPFLAITAYAIHLDGWKEGLTGIVIAVSITLGASICILIGIWMIRGAP